MRKLRARRVADQARRPGADGSAIEQRGVSAHGSCHGPRRRAVPASVRPRARSAMGRASVPLDGYAETMADANLADPEFEPSDEQLGELFRRAFAEVNSKHRESLARLRAEIARLRVEARRRVASGPR